MPKYSFLTGSPVNSMKDTPIPTPGKRHGPVSRAGEFVVGVQGRRTRGQGICADLACRRVVAVGVRPDRRSGRRPRWPRPATRIPRACSGAGRAGPGVSRGGHGALRCDGAARTRRVIRTREGPSPSRTTVGPSLPGGLPEMGQRTRSRVRQMRLQAPLRSTRPMSGQLGAFQRRPASGRRTDPLGRETHGHTHDRFTPPQGLNPRWKPTPSSRLTRRWTRLGVACIGSWVNIPSLASCPTKPGREQRVCGTGRARGVLPQESPRAPPRRRSGRLYWS